jgi:hypothetical protein
MKKCYLNKQVLDLQEPKSIPYISGGGFVSYLLSTISSEGMVPKTSEGIRGLFSNKNQVGSVPYIEDIVPAPGVTKSETEGTPPGDFSDNKDMNVKKFFTSL